jgi:hypothetical protein
VAKYPAGVLVSISYPEHRSSGCALHPAFYSRAQGDLYLEIKRGGREADQLPPFSAENKNHWSCSSTLSHAFIMSRSCNIVVKVKRRETCEMYGKRERSERPERCPQCERCDRK